jgi:type I restriction enzyme M protein
MLAHMKPVDEGGSRVAIIMNGSPLFTGDAGSGESEIRRWILENDWLEALIALPEQLFYNTGIATYVWVLTNRKAPARKGKVQLIDASHFDQDTKQGLFCSLMRKSLGDKRREIPIDRAQDILKILADFKDGDTRVIKKDGKQEDEVVSKIFPTTHFGFRKITVERPLRLNFQATPERIARLEEESAFRNLAVSKKKNAKEKAKEEAEGRKEQEAIRKMLATLPTTLFKESAAFESTLDKAVKAAGLRVPAPIRKTILSALSERDETAEICRDTDGNPEPDPELRDTENVPLSETIEDYFEREVKPYVPDAWINTAIRDEKDSQVGKVGYEINFNRYFYKYSPPRPLESIDADIKSVEKDILDMLREVGS